MSNTFKVGDRVTHKSIAIKGEGTVVFLPSEIGYEDLDAYGVRYDNYDYSKKYSKSPDGLDYHTARSKNLELVNKVDSHLVDVEGGKSYWITFTDGSRVKVEVTEDSRGELDARNDRFDFMLWLGQKGEPANRHWITSIEEVES